MKSTDDLLKDLKSTKNIDDYISSNKIHFADVSLSDYLHKLLKEKKLKQADVIKRSELDSVYGCQIFSGKKNPTRDKVLCIAFGMGLNLAETQQLLKSCGLPFLYAKHKRDSIIIFAINRNLSLIKTNELLYAQEEKLLG